MSGQENEYFKQLTGSAGANMIFVVAFILYRALQNRCKNSKSKCATHCGFCDLEIENDESSSDIEEGNNKRHENTRGRMPEMQQGDNRELPERNPTTSKFDIRKILEPENWNLVNETRAEKGIRETAPIEEAVALRLRSQSS